MPTYSDDIDLLSYEPHVFRDAAWASQALFTGTGDLAGTTLTLVGGGTLASTPVEPRNVVVLAGTGVNGTYPIVTRASNTQLTISTLYDDLLPPGSAAGASPVATAAGLTVAVRTFSPQASIVSGLLTQACGIVAGTGDEQTVTIVNPTALRMPCALGTLAMIYGTLAAAAGADANLRARADLYDRAYRRAMRSVVAHLDIDGDGVPDVVRRLNVLELARG